MKRSKKVTIGIIIFFIIIATVIGGRTAMGLYFKKKFGKRPPPGVVVEIVSEKRFNKTIESYCTALSSKTKSFKIKKSELLEPLKFKAAKKGEIISVINQGKDLEVEIQLRDNLIPLLESSNILIEEVDDV